MDSHSVYPLVPIKVSGLLSSTAESTRALSHKVRSRELCDAALTNSPLLPGVYTIDVAVGTWDQVLDSVDHVGRITVLPSDYFQSGELPSSHHGVLALKAKWTGIRADQSMSMVGFDTHHVSPLVLPPTNTDSESAPSNFSVYDWR